MPGGDVFADCPGIAAYLETLPKGFNSYPECHFAAGPLFEANEILRGTHDDVYEAVMGSFAEARTGWIPDVRAVSCSLAIRDLCFLSNKEFHAWMAETMRTVLSGPIYRALFTVLSPSLLLMGASKRWAKLRRGSTLVNKKQSVEGARRVCKLEVEMPPGLFPRFIIESIAQRFVVTLEMSRAKQPAVAITESHATQANFVLSWDV